MVKSFTKRYCKNKINDKSKFFSFKEVRYNKWSQPYKTEAATYNFSSI